LETLYFGKGGEVMVRVYDKLAEVQASGKGEYLLALYGESGIASGEQVQRVEAQVRGKALRSMHVMTAEDAIGRCGDVFLYVVGKWLRLIDPATASRRERAVTDPRWSAVQAAQVAAGAQAADRIQSERHAPALDRIVPMLIGLLVSARRSTRDHRGGRRAAPGRHARWRVQARQRPRLRHRSTDPAARVRAVTGVARAVPDRVLKFADNGYYVRSAGRAH
jgi:hypothetical protein